MTSKNDVNIIVDITKNSNSLDSFSLDSLNSIVPDSHSDYNRVVIHAPKQYLSDIIKEQGIQFERGGVYHVVCPTGTGKSTYFANLPDTVFATSLSLTAVQLADAVGASIHAPTVETDVLVHEGGYYFPSDKVTTTYESLPFVLSCARERPIAQIVIDEIHNSWTSGYRSSSLLKAFDEALRYKESHPETAIITLTGTRDFMSSHPLFEGASQVDVERALSVRCVIVEGDAKERITDCIGRLKEGGRHFVFLNSKGGGLDRFIATALTNGIERDEILAVNADVKDVVQSADFGAYRVIVSTAVMQEGYSLYGDFDGVHLLTAAPPSIMHQFSQRIRDVIPPVYWYTGQDEEGEGAGEKLATYGEVLKAQNQYKRYALKTAVPTCETLNEAIADENYGYVADSEKYGINAHYVTIAHDERGTPVSADVNYVMIDCLAYANGVHRASRNAVKEWLGRFGWVFIEETRQKKAVLPADSVDVQLAKEARLDAHNALCDEIYDDGQPQTAADIKRRKATKERGLLWKGAAMQCVAIYDALPAEDRTWALAVGIVRHCEGKASAIGRCKKIIALQANSDSDTNALIVAMFKGERLSGRDSAMLYLRCLIDAGIAGERAHRAMLARLQSADGNAKKHDGLIKKVLRKLDLVMSRESARGARERLWHWHDTAYNALIAEIVTPNEGNSLKSSSFGVTENEETRQKKGDFFILLLN